MSNQHNVTWCPLVIEVVPQWYC